MSLPPAVILAAGESSRFWPLSTHGHKSLHRLCGRPIIEHALRSFAAAGGSAAIIVQSTHAPLNEFAFRTIEETLGDGESFGLSLTFVDMVEPTGARDAIMLAAPHLSGDFLVINPENLNAGDLAVELVTARNGAAAVVAAQERPDPWSFGVFKEAEGKLTGYVEKPAPGTEPSRLCNMGIQLLGLDYLELLRHEASGDPEGNLKALLRLSENAAVRIHTTSLPFFPLKYPWDLFRMAEYLKPSPGPYLGENVQIDPTATVGDDSVIEQDTVIGPGVAVRGSLIGAGSRIDSPVTSSILGADVTVARDVTIEHQSGEGGAVIATVKGHSVDSGRDSLGTVIGQGTAVVSGTTLGAGSLIGAGNEMEKDVPPAGSVPDAAGRNN